MKREFKMTFIRRLGLVGLLMASPAHAKKKFDLTNETGMACYDVGFVSTNGFRVTETSHEFPGRGFDGTVTRKCYATLDDGTKIIYREGLKQGDRQTCVVSRYGTTSEGKPGWVCLEESLWPATVFSKDLKVVKRAEGGITEASWARIHSTEKIGSREFELKGKNVPTYGTHLVCARDGPNRETHEAYVASFGETLCS